MANVSASRTVTIRSVEMTAAVEAVGLALLGSFVHGRPEMEPIAHVREGSWVLRRQVLVTF